MSFLSPDSEFMETVSRCVDYILLNILCLVFCLPIVTVGASMTAKYYVSMKLVRGEEPAVWKAFWKSFKKNFRQSTLVWVIYFVILAFLAADWYLILEGPGKENVPSIFPLFLLVVSFLAAGSMFCVFPMLARFHIRTAEAIRGAVTFTLMKLPRMLLLLILVVLPYFIGMWYIEWFLAVWFLVTAVALYYNSKMFVKEFKKLEPEDSTDELYKEEM